MGTQEEYFLGVPRLLVCGLDGRACTRFDVAQGKVYDHILWPVAATLDKTRDKILFFTGPEEVDDPDGNAPDDIDARLFRCNGDGNACSSVRFPKLSEVRFAFFDATRDKLIVVGESWADDPEGGPKACVCDAEGSSCACASLTERPRAAAYAEASGKLSVLHYDGIGPTEETLVFHPIGTECDTGNMLCATRTLPGIAQGVQSATARLVSDRDGTLYGVHEVPFADPPVRFFRCAAGFSACMDVGSSQAFQVYGRGSMTLDPSRGRVIYVAPSRAADRPLGMFLDTF